MTFFVHLIDYYYSILYIHNQVKMSEIIPNELFKFLLKITIYDYNENK